MGRFEVETVVGEGSYGVVFKCKNKETGEVVAIKKLKESDDNEIVRQTTSREVKMLSMLKHSNIVHLKETFRSQKKLCLVFEYIEKTLAEVLESRPTGLSAEEVRQYIYQLVQALNWCHQHNVVHRDIKPDNLLISSGITGSSVGHLKLCDFGFGRLLPANIADVSITDYVGTRWYHAPELLLRSSHYGKEVDIWAIGCIMAELSDGNPLFPGNSDIDQLHNIQKMIGPLCGQHNTLFMKNSRFAGLKFPDLEPPITLDAKFKSIMTPDALDFMKGTLAMDPGKRLNSLQCLNHPYLADLTAKDSSKLQRQQTQVPPCPTSTASTTTQVADGCATATASSHLEDLTSPVTIMMGQWQPAQQPLRGHLAALLAQRRNEAHKLSAQLSAPQGGAGRAAVNILLEPSPQAPLPALGDPVALAALLGQRREEARKVSVTLQAVAAASEQQLLDLKEEVEQSLQQEAVLQLEQKQELEASKAQLQDKHDTAGATLVDSAAQVDELAAALKDNEQQLKHARQQLQATAAAAADSQGVAVQRQQDLEALAAAHKGLQKELNNTLDSLEASQQERAAVTSELAEKAVQLAACKQELQTEVQAHSETTACLNDRNSQVATLQGQLEALQQELAAVSSSLKQEQQQHAATRVFLAAEQAVAAKTKAQLQEEQHQHADTQHWLQEEQGTAASLAEKLRLAEQQLASEVAHLAEVSAALEQEQEKLSLEQAAHANRKLLEQGQQQLLQDANARAAASTAAHASVTAELAATQQQLDESHEQLQHSAGNLAALQQELQEATASIQTLKSEKAELRNRVAEWQEEMARMDAVVEELNVKINEQEQKEAGYQEMQAELHEQLATLGAYNSSAEASLAESRAVEAKLTRETVQLNAQLQEHVDKHQQLQNALQQAEEQYKTQAPQLAEAMAAWSSREDELLGEQQSVVEQVRAQTELNDQVQDQLKDLGQQLNFRDNEISKLSADNEHLGLELGRARGETQKQQVQLQELESMRQELAATYESNAELRDRVSVVQQELAEVKAEAAARTPVQTNVQQSSDDNASGTYEQVSTQASAEEEVDDLRVEIPAPVAAAAKAGGLPGQAVGLSDIEAAAEESCDRMTGMDGLVLLLDVAHASPHIHTNLNDNKKTRFGWVKGALGGASRVVVVTAASHLLGVVALKVCKCTSTVPRNRS